MEPGRGWAGVRDSRNFLGGRGVVLAVIFQIASEVQHLSGRAPHLDFALAAVSLQLGLPRGSAQGLLLVGRTVGWIAHAIEQYAAGVIIRPRARYVGILPDEIDDPAQDR